MKLTFLLFLHGLEVDLQATYLIFEIVFGLEDESFTSPSINDQLIISECVFELIINHFL